MWVVLPGAAPTRAKFFRLSSRLITDDFPTFDRPAKATWGSRSRGKSAALAAERTNSAFCKFTRILSRPHCRKVGTSRPATVL